MEYLITLGPKLDGNLRRMYFWFMRGKWRRLPESRALALIDHGATVIPWAERNLAK